MRRKGISDALAMSVMSMYEGAKTRVIVDYELSENLRLVRNFTSSLHTQFNFALLHLIHAVRKEE